MKRLKTFGLAAAMALVVTAALGAASASASHFAVPGGGNALWKGAINGGNHVLQLGPEKFSCSNSSFSGTGWDGQVSLTVAPELSECTWGTSKVNWQMGSHGCKYTFRPAVGSSTPLGGYMDIEGCTSPLQVGKTGCIIEIGNQNNLGPVEYNNAKVEGTPGLIIKANITNFPYTLKGSFCNKAAGTYTNGTYTGEWAVKGYETNESIRREVEIVPDGSHSPSYLRAEEAPVTITGARAEEKSIFVLGGNGGVFCSGHALNGEATSLSSSSLTLSATYSGCTWIGENATMSMGGCSYVLHVNGEFDIAGATCASNPITISIPWAGHEEPWCKATIGPQSGLSGVTYADEGSGRSRSVKTGGIASSVVATGKGVGCLQTGTFSTGSYRSIDRLTATNASKEQRGFWFE